MNEALKNLPRRALSSGALLLALACAPLAGSAQIAFDSAASTDGSKASTVTWTHTVGSGSNTALVVGVALDDTTASNLTVSAITYNGTAMTAVPSSIATAGTSTINQTQLFYLLSPAAGAHTVSVTFAGAVKASTLGSISLSGVSQAAPTAVAVNSTASGKTISTSVNVATAGSWLVDAVCANNSSGSFTAGSSQTKRYDVNNGTADGAGSTESVSAAGTATASWTPASSGRIAQSVAVFAPASGSSGTAPTITTQPANQTVTAGGTATFTVVASGTAPLAYQWKFGSSTLSGATSTTLSIANAQAANAGSYTVTVSNSVGSVTSTAATLTVNAAATAPTITTQPANQTVTAGGTATFTVVASGTAPLAYQWKFGSSTLSGATSTTLSITNAQSANAGSYTVTVSNSVGSVTSTAATLTVNASATAPTITTQPANQTVTAGGTASFAVVASGTAPLAYQWKFGSSTLSGATSATLSITNAQSANAGSYTVTVSNSVGSVTSTAATLTVNASGGGGTGSAATVTTQPASQSVAAGSTVTFTVVASGTSPISYQWQLNGTNISGATSSSYTLTNVQAANAGAYTVTVTNSSGNDASLIATLTTQPIIPSGVFNVTSYGAKGDGSTDNTTAIQNAINAASAAGGGTVEIPAASSAYESGPLTLANSLNLQVDSGAELQALPKSTYPSASTNFITASGNHDVEISGAGTIDGNGSTWWSTSTRPKLVHMSSTTTVYIKDTGTSTHLTFSNSMKEHFITDTEVNNVTVDGLHISAPGTSPNTDGMDPAGNDWIIENCNISDGDDNVAVKAQTTSASDILVNNCTIGTGHGLSIGAQTDYGVSGFRVTNCSFSGTDYVVRLKAERGEGGLVSNVLYDNVTYTGIDKAVIYISSYYDSLPSNPSSDGGSTFNATTTPQWQNIVIRNLSGSTTSDPSKGLGDIWGVPESPINGVILDNVTITGSTKTLTINHARNVSYVNGTSLALTSGSDDLYDVNPVITLEPLSQSVSPGAAVTFSVTAASTATPTYQWYKNGSAISGATASTYTISSAQTSDAASYSVGVTNASGTNTSDDAILTVN